MRSKKRPDSQKQRTFIEEARRAQIIDAAIDTIAAKGFPNASLARIAERAGISKGVISYHFAGKEDLMHEVVVKVYTAIGEYVGPMIAEQPDAVSALRMHITGVGEYVLNNRNKLLALSGIFTGAISADGKPKYGFTDNDPIYAGLEALFAWGQDSGVFRHFDRRVMAVTVQSSLDAAFGYWRAVPEHDLQFHIAELCESVTRMVRAD
ncbi:MAG TPA: TetR/AcrR family transcriptional regulator [Candidatus Stackebrandtia faecavium]|nr:TetR/AcrR family transcriptional regulator [Candidatus Stackebrandtia faecavium]